jgi:uncharacterized damage-inducible protein DinB
MFAHVFWADARVLHSLEAASAEARALELFAHLLAAEHVWLTRLEGAAAKVAVWPALTLEECCSLAAENRAGYERLLESARDADLAREVAYVNSAGAAFRSPAADILLQVALHGAYHRGQIALLLRNAEVAPAPTDFIAFARGAPAASRSTTSLVPILRDGTPGAPIGAKGENAARVSQATAALYERIGYAPPWIAYFICESGECVGTCAFKSAPRDGRVEIAYFTFPEHEGRGVASRAAAELVRIARNAAPSVEIVARTLPEENASTSILKKLGFSLTGTVDDPEDGSVWEWRFGRAP